MFCTKCGKKLFDGDAFCGYCGAKVREELMFKTETTTPARTTRYDEVIFNPPFKAEASRRTQHIEEEMKPYSSEPVKEKVTLDWNLDGFPPAERRRDDFEINWDAVIEKKKESRSVNIEKILPEMGFKTEEPVVKPKKEEESFNFFLEPKKEESLFVEQKAEEKAEEKTEEKIEETLNLFAEPKEEEPLSIEDLEKALFGTEDFEAVDESDLGVTVEYKAFKEKKKEEEFRTFNSKRDAFQELLDKERERLEALENERKSQWDELTKKDEVEYVPKKALAFEEVFKEPKLPLVPPLKEVAVVLPPLTARVMADDPENVVEPWYQVVLPPLTARVEPLLGEYTFPSNDGEETEEPELDKQEKTKLRYSDIFPVDAFDTTDNDEPNKYVKEEVKLFFDDVEEDDDEEDEEKSGNGFIKFLIVILAIVVVAELVLIGAKFMAPESKLALMADDLMAKVTGIFVDNDSDNPVSYTEDSPIEKYVSQLSSTAKHVGKITSDATLKYDLSKPYAYSEIPQTNEFKDVPWGADKEKTSGYLIVEALVGYYDGWKANHPDEEVVGINQVSIGEVRTGSGGYYALNKVIYAGTTGDVTEKYESVYLEASGDKIMVKEVKEEAI